MGQAKKRGSFEQRRARAVDRNRLIAHQIATSDNLMLKGLVRKFGIQQVACSLIKTGAINQLSAPEPEKSNLILPPYHENPTPDWPGPDPIAAHRITDGWGATPS